MASTSREAGAGSLRLNVLSNYAGKLWGILSVYVFVPLYIHFLGVEAYGLVAFYSVALAILFIVDAGMSASFAREAALVRNPRHLLDVLVSIEGVLAGIVLLTGIAVFFAARTIAEHWLSSTTLAGPVVVDSVRLMALALVPQLLMSLYFGGLMGLQRQVRANAVTMLFNAVRSGLVILPLVFWSDPRVFFAWQAGVSWVFLVLMRTMLRRELGASAAYRGTFALATLRPLVGYASGMFAMSVIAGLNTQLDRLVVSKMRPLEEFTYYSIAATLAQIPTIVTMPIAMALLPRLTALRDQELQASIRELYVLNSYAIAAAGSLAAFGLFFFADDVLTLWLNGRVIPSMIVQVIQILSIGGLFLALQLAPFQLSLANGHNRTNVRLGAAVLVLTIPMQIVLTSRYGLVGASIPWLVLNATAFVFLGIVLNIKFNNGYTLAWFSRYTLVPVLISGICMGSARTLRHAWSLGPWAAGSLASGFAVLACAVAFLIWPRLKAEHA
jgi:O-antigen/teichoic acid export membrane protein